MNANHNVDGPCCAITVYDIAAQADQVDVDECRGQETRQPQVALSATCKLFVSGSLLVG